MPIHANPGDAAAKRVSPSHRVSRVEEPAPLTICIHPAFERMTWRSWSCPVTYKSMPVRSIRSASPGVGPWCPCESAGWWPNATFHRAFDAAISFLKMISTAPLAPITAISAVGHARFKSPRMCLLLMTSYAPP